MINAIQFVQTEFEETNQPAGGRYPDAHWSGNPKTRIWQQDSEDLRQYSWCQHSEAVVSAFQQRQKW
jgi:hypothetical protein